MNFKERVLYLAEDIKDLSKLTSRKIYKAGKRGLPDFDYKKGLDALIKKSKIGNFIHLAGKDWKEFDYEKGLNALIKVDEEGYRIHLAGKDWKEFDYDKGLNALIKINSFHDIFNAGIYWRKFDYEKGLEFLKKKNELYYSRALTKWPKNIKQSQAISKEIKNKAKLMKDYGKKYEL